jgi:hypothetical protein
MTTVRQINGLLTEGHTGRLFGELCQYRSDVPPALMAELGGSALATAALAAIRLQELSQTQTPVSRNLIAKLVASQESNGGWGNTLVTAMATRALLNDPESRPAAIRGVVLLTQLQKDDGSLPREAVRRLPGDAIATAFVLVQLARSAEFANRFRLEAAVHTLTTARATIAPAMLPFVKLAVQRASSMIGGQAMGLVQLAMAS